MTRPHLSASSIASYLDCGLQYRFSKVDRIKPEFIPDALVFGTAIHRVLEYFHHQRMQGEKPSILELSRLFEERWEQEAGNNPDIQFKEGKDYDILLQEGKSLIAVYLSTLPENSYTVLALEEPFSFTIPGVNLPIIGAIDMIEQDESGTIIVTDHKTSSRSYSADEVDKNFQLTLYGMALKSNGYQGREIILRLDCLIKTKKPKFEQYYTVRSPQDESRVVKKVQVAWGGMSQGVYLPNDGSWKCPGCSFKTHCDQWFQE